jgi:hypothetical protein
MSMLFLVTTSSLVAVSTPYNSLKLEPETWFKNERLFRFESRCSKSKISRLAPPAVFLAKLDLWEIKVVLNFHHPGIEPALALPQVCRTASATPSKAHIVAPLP